MMYSKSKMTLLAAFAAAVLVTPVSVEAKNPDIMVVGQYQHTSCQGRRPGGFIFSKIAENSPIQTRPQISRIRSGLTTKRCIGPENSGGNSALSFDHLAGEID
jgi:hypothetical protein